MTRRRVHSAHSLSVRLLGHAAIAAGLCAALVQFGGGLHAQIPGRNVNMVAGQTWPDGDPFLQRQNEPSVAASTRNPLHMLGGSNDYRTVDIPYDAAETGDAWLGVYKSTDGGQRWTSNLLPGYPQDPNRAQSPLRIYSAAADPVVRAGTNGLIYYAGLAFNRDENGASGVFVARFIDNNNREAGDPFAYLGTRIVASDSGATGRFLDKPWMAVDIPRGGGTCPVTTTVTKPPATPGGAPITVNETHNLPAGPVYVAYSAFTGSGATLRSEILFQYSADCGVTWSTPQRLSGTEDALNQGASIAIDPSTGNVYVAWRRFTRLGSRSTDAMMVARSVNLGRRFVPAQVARKMPRGRQLGRLMEKILEHRKPKEAIEVEELSEFDQGTSAADLSFRTNSYPTIAFDDKSRLYMAWAERGYSTMASRSDQNTGDAKILMSTSANGVSWTPPAAVSEPDQPGHQIMPSLAFAGGKLLLLYYDLRETVAQVYGPFIDDLSAATSGKRHTIDIRASMGTPGSAPSFAPSVRVSDYFIGHRPGGPKPGARLVPCPLGGGTDCEQLQFNAPNLPMFKLGTVPFLGDYIDIAPAPAFVPAGRGGWMYNTSKNAVPVFHAVWTDNRDVRPPKPGTGWDEYTAPYVPGLSRPSLFDPTKTIPGCIADNTGMRNQNIYTARITGGLLVGSPSNTKPLSPTLQRGFVVFAQNMTTVQRAFRMRIVNQPVGGTASFQQISPAPVTFLDVITPPRSTVSRTVYVTSTDEHARINVEVFEIDAVGASQPTEDGLNGVIILNADIENADIENADIENADIENADIENTEVTNADIENPTVRVADIENADIENADIENADIENADIENADIENADIENADIENSSFEDAPTTDVTWSVTNTGNTTTAFNVNLFLAQAAPTTGVKVQLILHKSYITPAAATCELKKRSNTVLVANITNPVFVTPDSGGLGDPNSPDASNATLWLAPGETGKFTLRIRDTDPTNNVTIINDKGESISIDQAFVPGVTLEPIVVPQEIGTADLEAGVTKPPVSTTDGSTMFFLQQPVSSGAGVIMAPVTVQVRDKSGAVLPGIDVTLSLGTNPTGATLGGLLTQQTDSRGIAIFDTLQIGVPGDGYRLRATASQGGSPIGVSPADSLPFSVRILVLHTGDAGPGSLREAILLANANVGVTDTVAFAIPGSAPHTIALTQRLPSILDAVTLTASPGGTCSGLAPTVEIDGSQIDASGPGLVVNASGTTIRGLAITGFSGNGIELRAGLSLIECTHVGVGTDGFTMKPNAGNGIQLVDAGSNVIGGVSPAQRNIISANGGEGLRMDGPGSTGNVIQGNFIGTGADGVMDLGNGASGIYLRRAPGNIVRGNVVAGNNGFAGIAICGNATFCGGGDIVLTTSNAAGNILRGNTVRGNSGLGVSIDSAPGTIVGGTASGEPNVIQNNAVGVYVFGPATTGTRISHNSIDLNAGLGIDLGGDGVTPNDVEEADGRQNFPVLRGASSNGSTIAVSGSLHSTPDTLFQIELFNSPTCDASGNGEGRSWFGSVQGIATDANGDLLFSASIGINLPSGSVVTATATDAAGNTSEFSPCESVVVPPEPVDMGSVGGEGGTPFGPFFCPTGSVATSLRGHAGDDIDRTEIWCTPLAGGNEVQAGAVGGFSGESYGEALVCPTGSTITGLHGRAGTVLWGGFVVDTLGVTCGNPKTGAAVSLGPIGNAAPNASPFTLSCEAGKSVVAIYGGQGGLLDRIGIYCQ